MGESEAADSYNVYLRGTLTKRKKPSQEDTVHIPTPSRAQSQVPSTTAGNWTSTACFRQRHCTSYLEGPHRKSEPEGLQDGQADPLVLDLWPWFHLLEAYLRGHYFSNALGKLLIQRYPVWRDPERPGTQGGQGRERVLTWEALQAEETLLHSTIREHLLLAGTVLRAGGTERHSSPPGTYSLGREQRLGSSKQQHLRLVPGPGGGG